MLVRDIHGWIDTHPYSRSPMYYVIWYRDAKDLSAYIKLNTVRYTWVICNTGAVN
jgi:hypothetical protein